MEKENWVGSICFFFKNVIFFIVLKEVSFKIRVDVINCIEVVCWLFGLIMLF